MSGSSDPIKKSFIKMKMANESSLKDLLHNLLPAPQRGCLR